MPKRQQPAPDKAMDQDPEKMRVYETARAFFNDLSEAINETPEGEPPNTREWKHLCLLVPARNRELNPGDALVISNLSPGIGNKLIKFLAGQIVRQEREQQKNSIILPKRVIH